MDPHMYTASLSHTMDPYNFNHERVEVNTTKISPYVRHPKPPYTYLGLAVMAIQISPKKALNLSGIVDTMAKMFPFFRSSYTGWRASIRHTLSKYDCFVRKVNSEWTVDLTKVQSSAFRRQETVVAREGDYAFELHKELQVSRVKLPSDIKYMPTSKFDSSSSDSSLSSSAMSPILVVDGSPKRPSPKIEKSKKSASHPDPVTRFMKIEQTDDESVTRSTSSEPCRRTSHTDFATISAPIAPTNDNHCMKKSPVWSTRDTYQPVMSETLPPSTSEHSSCMQHSLPAFNSFFAGTAQDISPDISMPILSPMWSTTRGNDTDNSFSQSSMPDLTPVWKILSQSISTDASSEYRTSPTPPHTFTDLTAPIGTSTPVERKATNILRLPFRSTPENQTTKFLMDDILAERDGPADRPCTAKPTSSTHYSPSRVCQSTDVDSAVTSQLQLPDCQRAEVPASGCQTSSQSYQVNQESSDGQMSQQQIPSCQFLPQNNVTTDAPAKAPKRKRTRRTKKMIRETKSAQRQECPPTPQSNSQAYAIDNLQRVCQNYNFSMNPFNSSAPSTFDQVLPAASTPSFHYPQQQNYVNYPGYCNPHLVHYQAYPYMQLSYDASSHFPMVDPYYQDVYTAQQPDVQPVDLSSSRDWVTQ